MSIPFFDKLNLFDIVWRHQDTLVDARDRAAIDDYVAFYGVPLAVCIGLAYGGVVLSNEAIGVMTNALALLAGLLFNLLVLLQALRWPGRIGAVKGLAATLRNQVYANIAYAILVSLVAIVPLVIAANYDKAELARPDRQWAAFIALGLVLHFGLTMCMVLKRMHVLLRQEFRKGD